MFYNYSNGGIMIAMPATFTANCLLEVFSKHKVTSLRIVPPILRLIGNDERFQKKHLDNLKNVVFGAVSINERIVTKFTDKLSDKFTFVQGYYFEYTKIKTHLRRQLVNDSSVQKISPRFRRIFS